jgi:alkylglycerol monooxygenase
MTGFLILVGIIATAFIAIVSYDAVLSYRKNIRVYTLADSLANVYCGILERSFDLFYAVIFLMASQYLYENVAPFKLPANLGTWLLGLILFDFIAYWFHRLSHEINFLWAAHIVHHQSEELNFTTVFRVSFFAVIFRSFFFLWMPLIGFDPFTIFTLGVFLAGYQFLTHSRMIGSLGVLEEFMTTPSHHRVHHGRNEKYMDHNYGHIFIVWDRLFGTFVKEEEEPLYGITSGFESNSPLSAQFSYWNDLFTRAYRTKSFGDKIRVFLKGPAWTPKDVGFLPSAYRTDKKGDRIKRDVRITKEMSSYIIFAIITSAAIFFRLTFIIKQMEGPTLASLIQNSEVIALTVSLLISVFAQGRVMDNSRIALPFEVLRLLCLSVLSVIFYSEISWILPLMVAYSLISAVWYAYMKLSKSEESIRLAS